MDSASTTLLARVRSQKASLFEAEVSWSAAKRPADNQMIEHVDLQNPGSFAEPASQPHIGFTGSRVPSYAAYGILVLYRIQFYAACEPDCL
jgi:hypothetical protein